MDDHETRKRTARFSRSIRAAWLNLLSVAEHTIDALSARALVVRREIDLFAGLALSTIGLLHFQTGKYCDGNTADYLSCTRPTAFYYYPVLSILLVVIGAFLLALWFLAHRREA